LTSQVSDGKTSLSGRLRGTRSVRMPLHSVYDIVKEIDQKMQQVFALLIYFSLSAQFELVTRICFVSQLHQDAQKDSIEGFLASFISLVFSFSFFQALYHYFIDSLDEPSSITGLSLVLPDTNIVCFEVSCGLIHFVLLRDPRKLLWNS
jgi:hypothetical protein